MVRILFDEDVESAGMKFAVDCMHAAFRQHAAGQLVAPGRIVSDLQIGKLAFTVGASRSGQAVVGFRCYDFDQLQSPNRSEVTAVFSAGDGSLCGLVVGPWLGAVRTGAIGGVAIDRLARGDSKSLGLIGTGYQAQTQLAAALAVRDFQTVRVFSRHVERRRVFADRASGRFDCDVQAVESARRAVEDADVLICSTTSPDPVVEPSWLKPGVHINNVGPKFKARHELGLNVLEQACLLVTDAPAQVEALGDDFVLSGTPLAAQVRTLSELEAQPSQAHDDSLRTGRPASVFISLGLAGTEVLLAQSLLARQSDTGGE